MLNINNPYLNLTQRIALYERWLLIHSYLYYELNEPMKTDFEFDCVKKELLRLRKKQKNKTRYSSAFDEEWNGSCFELFSKCSKSIQESIIQDCELIIERKNRYGIDPSYSAVIDPRSNDKHIR